MSNESKNKHEKNTKVSDEEAALRQLNENVRPKSVPFERTGNKDVDAKRLQEYLKTLWNPHKYFFWRKYDGGQPLYVINFDNFKFGFCRTFTPDIKYTWEKIMFLIEVNHVVKYAPLFKVPNRIQKLLKWVGNDRNS